jgi:hypothetical protein
MSFFTLISLDPNYFDLSTVDSYFLLPEKVLEFSQTVIFVRKKGLLPGWYCNQQEPPYASDAFSPIGGIRGGCLRKM